MTGETDKDPRYCYPRPDFDEQPQPIPGQERKMTLSLTTGRIPM